MRFRNFWLGEPATIPEILRYRKAAGYTLREDLRRIWETRLVWYVLRLVPRELKYWVVIQAAVRGEKGNPGEVKTLTLLKRLEKI